MCESCAALIVLQGFSETDPKKRQPAYAAFDYDLRDQTDNAEPWIAPVQPLTNLQGRFHWLLNQQSQEVRDRWRYCHNRADDFEFLMKEMTDGTPLGRSWAGQLIQWYGQHTLDN